MYWLDKYNIRKICVAKELGLKNIKISLNLGISKEEVFIEENKIILPNKEVLELNKICQLKNSDSIFIIENGEVYEHLELGNNLFARFITNGEIDYPNLEINGEKLYQKQIPIKDLEKYIKENSKGKILQIFSKLGYYAISLYKSGYDIIVFEENKYMIKLLKYNPFSSDFFKFKIPYIIGRIYKIGELKKSFDTIIYCPPPMKKATRYYYSKIVLKNIRNILKEDGILIIDLEPPKLVTINRLINNLSTKLMNLGFEIEVNKKLLILKAYAR